MNISDWTIRRLLHIAGLTSKIKQVKPKLNRQHIRDHFAFAKHHEHWTIHEWKCDIFSDETKVNRFCSDGRSWC